MPTSKAVRSTHSDAPSSPIRVNRDPDEALYEYIAYHKLRRPNQAAAWDTAYEALQANMIEIEQIRALTLEKLESWGIPYGVAMGLRDHVKIWYAKKRINAGDRDDDEERPHSSLSI